MANLQKYLAISIASNYSGPPFRRWICSKRHSSALKAVVKFDHKSRFGFPHSHVVDPSGGDSPIGDGRCDPCPDPHAGEGGKLDGLP